MTCWGIYCHLIWILVFCWAHRSLYFSGYFRHMLKQLTLSTPSDRKSVSTIEWIIAAEVIRTKRNECRNFVEIFYLRTNGDGPTSYLEGIFYFRNARIQEFKFCRHLFAHSTAFGHSSTGCKHMCMRVDDKLNFFILFGFAPLHSRTAPLTMCLWFIRFCCMFASHGDCFTDGDKLNDA